MAALISPQTFEAYKQAAGIAGNIFAFGLFVSPMNPLHLCPLELLNLCVFKMSALLLAVFGLFAVIAIGSLLVTDLELRHLIIGFLSCATLISMFASPLSVMVPNGIGTILGIGQLVLYFYYNDKPKQETREPLIESFA
ncbi:hypothetical protein L1987_19227 [Smallanthus sonchifolius]|uniref:Uncharacterized protein n=1 Tax=Smallanthus sonchifolius TaxID=185202 RepID=A0ACB9IP95_9ASTR|nr:hypothetical protein L1987_19227 [Smallanthus sonchifolius]